MVERERAGVGFETRSTTFKRVRFRQKGETVMGCLLRTTDYTSVSICCKMKVRNSGEKAQTLLGEVWPLSRGYQMNAGLSETPMWEVM